MGQGWFLIRQHNPGLQQFLQCLLSQKPKSSWGNAGSVVIASDRRCRRTVISRRAASSLGDTQHHPLACHMAHDMPAGSAQPFGFLLAIHRQIHRHAHVPNEALRSCQRRICSSGSILSSWPITSRSRSESGRQRSLPLDPNTARACTSPRLASFSRPWRKACSSSPGPSCSDRSSGCGSLQVCAAKDGMAVDRKARGERPASFSHAAAPFRFPAAPRSHPDSPGAGRWRSRRPAARCPGG